MHIDMRVMELLASKICHDLVSPVSAINNGVELIEDIGGSVVDEAMKLIGDSGASAARRLRLFRMAYGRAGSDESLSLRDVRQVIEHYLSGGKISLVWADGQMNEGTAVQRGYLKTILNMTILAEETLAYGGLITIRAAAGDASRLEVVGRNAHLSPQMEEALAGATEIDELTPRSIQAYVTGRFAEHFGLRLDIDQSIPDRLDLTLSHTPASAQIVPSAEAEPYVENERESMVISLF